MTTSISCAVFLRLCGVALQPGERRPEPFQTREFFRCVRIEKKRGSVLAVASNGGILAVERIGEWTGPDMAVNIALVPSLIDACEKEAKLAGSIAVENMMNVRTTFGFTTLSFCPQDYIDWRAHMPPKIATKSTGGAVFDADDIVRLARSAPSGAFVTPKYFDHTKPVILRDPHDLHWMGVFMASDAGEAIPPAELPEWL